MPYSTDEINLAIDNFYKEDPNNERILMWQGDPVYEALYDQMEGKSFEDNGYNFSFDVKYAARGRGTAMGSGPLNVGANDATRVRGSDARGGCHWIWQIPERTINTLSGPKQLGQFLEKEMTGEAIQIGEYQANQLLCGTGGGPDLMMSQFFTLNGGDATPVTYTPLDGIARNGLINFQSTAAQISAGITRHGISAATVNKFVTQFVDNSAGSWAAGTQQRNLQKLIMACERGTPAFDRLGRKVQYRSPTHALCTNEGYLSYYNSLTSQVRYLKGGDDGSDFNTGYHANARGGLLIGKGLPLWYCPTIDDAMTAGTAYSGYNGVLMLINTNFFMVRYLNQNGAPTGQGRQHGRVWRMELMPPLAREDSRTFKGTKEEQIVCLVPGSCGGMKNWDAA